MLLQSFEHIAKTGEQMLLLSAFRPHIEGYRGYVVWGGPPAMGPIDGTVAPSAAGGSLPFLPQSTLRVLKNVRKNYPKAWCRYGFVNAFNPLIDWYDTDVIGIDTGITMLMAENLRTEFVWQNFMKNPEAVVGPGDTIVLPELTEPWIFMHEAELALVIKGPAKKVSRENWRSAVFGYTGLIDVSARGEGRRTWKARSARSRSCGPGGRGA